MITCCEISLVLCGVILALFAMTLNYNLQLSAKQIKLEAKNGAEQHQIDELKAELQALKSSMKPNNSIPTPPAPLSPKPIKPKSPNKPTDFVAELKQKQQAGKLKPSDFKA